MNLEITPLTDAIYQWYCSECEEFVTNTTAEATRESRTCATVECPECEESNYVVIRNRLEQVGEYIYGLRFTDGETA